MSVNLEIKKNKSKSHSCSALTLARTAAVIAQSFALVSCASAAFAEEGFHTLKDNLPPALTEIEKSTVAVWIPPATKFGQVTGATAVLVKIKVDKQGNKKGLFLSNAHVMDKCLNASTCQYKVYHHYIYNHVNVPFVADKFAWYTDFKVIAFDPDVDLAAFVVSLPSKFNGQPAPMRVWAKNDNPRVYALGNPNTAVRTEWHVPKPQRHDHQTFWSTGVIGSVLDNSINGHVSKFVYSSTDLLPGNSGGPLVDVDGKLVGINRSIARVPNSAYLASDMYATSISIQTVELFLATVNF